MNKEKLITYISDGSKVSYLFFWGHTAKDKTAVGKECLSQWYQAAFTIPLMQKNWEEQ